MSHRIHQTVAACAALVALAFLFEPSSANAEVRGWNDGADSTPTMSDLIPTLAGQEAYSERYSFAIDLDGGGHIGVDWTISNLGWGDGHGATDVRVNLPDKDKYTASEKVKKKNWSYSKDSFELDIADTRIEAKGDDAFVLTHKGDGVSFELTLTNTVDMWRPGSGKIDTDDGYYKFNLVAPRADVSGTVTIDGESHEVESTRKGYGEHVTTNIAPFDLAKRFSRLRTSKDDVSIMWREIDLEDDHGGDSQTWIAVLYKDKIVFSDPDADIRFGRVRSDSDSGYRFPMDIQIDGRSGDDSVKLIMRGKDYEREDLLESYGAAAKAIASAVSKPYRYDVTCKYQLQMDIGGDRAVVSGDSHFVLDYLTD
ncbi:MAG: hypothetical protein ACOCV2_14750 [Persicimonas sp.]